MDVAFTMLLVNDIEAAKRFYIDVLGFNIERDGTDEVRLRCGSMAYFMLNCDKPAAGMHGHNASSTIVFAVDDIHQKMAQMRAQGVQFLHATPGSNELGQYAAFRDPAGIVHEIFQPARSN